MDKKLAQAVAMTVERCSSEITKLYWLLKESGDASSFQALEVSIGKLTYELLELEERVHELCPGLETESKPA